DFSLKCIKDKRIPVGITVLVTGLLLAIIALAARKCPSCPSCPVPGVPGCLESGIGLGDKCFYFVEKELDWDGSEASCLSHGSHLATIDSPEELKFLQRYGNTEHHWVGLRRGGSGSWEWFNGSLFNS
ncbi:CLC2A protein, partial [Sapayoa aenigma]|nr:CLC2A protein [Sapayoa aenigma]